jgi:hypothetical protein
MHGRMTHMGVLIFDFIKSDQTWISCLLCVVPATYHMGDSSSYQIKSHLDWIKTDFFQQIEQQLTVPNL